MQLAFAGLGCAYLDAVEAAVLATEMGQTAKPTQASQLTRASGVVTTTLAATMVVERQDKPTIQVEPQVHPIAHAPLTHCLYSDLP